MKIYLRDLTLANSCADVLADIGGDALTIELNPDHEYIVIDTDGTLDPYEHVSLDDIKAILVSASENNVSEDTLAILSRIYSFDEIKEFAANNFNNLIIIDFDDETKDWCCGNGVYPSDDNLGLVMYKNGYNYLPAEIPEELEDYIRWEQNWYSAETDSWRTATKENKTYIIKA